MQLEPSFFQHNQWYMFGNNRNGRKNSDLTGDVYSKMLPYQARLYVFSLSKIKQYWLLSGGVDYYDPARVRKHASCGHRVKYLKYITPLSKLVGVLLVIWWFIYFWTYFSFALPFSHTHFGLVIFLESLLLV